MVTPLRTTQLTHFTVKVERNLPVALVEAMVRPARRVLWEPVVMQVLLIATAKVAVVAVTTVVVHRDQEWDPAEVLVISAG